MKRKLVYTFLILFMSSSTAFCAPALTCDCSVATDLITGAALQIDNGAWIDVPVANTCRDVVCAGDSKVFCYDLTSLPNGSHTISAKFKNIWGESAASTPPLSFVKGGPSISPTIKIKP